MESHVSVRENEIVWKMYIILSKRSKLQNSVYNMILFKLKTAIICLSVYLRNGSHQSVASGHSGLNPFNNHTDDWAA